MALEFVTDRYASYSGVLEIQIPNDHLEGGASGTKGFATINPENLPQDLANYLQQSGLQISNTEKGNSWTTFRVNCSPGAGTEKINQHIEEIGALNEDYKVAPEYDHVYSRVILQGP